MCCCCCRWFNRNDTAGCCQHLLFCDQDYPCNIDLLPQTPHEEDNYEFSPDEVQPKRKTKIRMKWACARCCARFCTCCCRVDPCRCCRYFVECCCYCEKKYTPSPFCAFSTLVLCKILIFIGIGTYFVITSVGKYGTLLHIQQLRRERKVHPVDIDWLKNEYEGLEDDRNDTIRQVLYQRDFCCTALAAALCAYVVIIYIALAGIGSVLCKLTGCACAFIVVALTPLPGAIYQAVEYSYHQAHYLLTAHGITSRVNLTVYYGKEIYRKNENVLMWISYAILLPLEYWFLIWYHREIEETRMMHRLSGDYSLDDDLANYHPISTLFETLHATRAPTEIHSSYRLLQLNDPALIKLRGSDEEELEVLEEFFGKHLQHNPKPQITPKKSTAEVADIRKKVRLNSS